MDLLELILEYHKGNQRQGPGSEEATLKALSYIPCLNEKSRILDIGCGTGGQTITLAKNTAAQITAVDMFPQFLEMLMKNAKENNLTDRIVAEEMLMESLTFKEHSFDVIWSEGAVYNIGFEKGLSLWRKYLKEDGYIAVSEISWLTGTRPEEIEQYWVNLYSEIDTVENKLAVIEKCGYEIVSHFALDDKCWIDNYYQPLIDNSEEFLKKYNYADEVKDFLEQGKIEADMYNRFKDYYSYVFYIAKKNRSFVHQ
ncbi:methyltransferase domain-containing protein [Lachnospiraceae bacterium MD1]|uniref:Methyltransferase domain-containing protein n=1 Tax=Variimorphobacter saccharofermentans TaxID=2755051 RepID=A0A839K2C6_9FIRM|nr:class I SAM-dependent methyltransferase [Variimorphobacter saccharofermentans]MBB2183548.1 methyltransferase domain-containing protein [Variimorphobacter saccharofermentans]